MSFENIKVGDTVMVSKSINYSWNSSKSFWIPCQVEKVTPKRFVINGVEYNKKDGSCHGDRNKKQVFLMEIHIEKWNGIVTIKDETKEMEEFKTKLKQINKIQTMCDSISKKINNAEAKNDLVNSIYENIKKSYDELTNV